LNTPDAENATGGDAEVEITDLDAPETSKGPGRYTRRRREPSSRGRLWMSIAVIEGIVLLAVVVLVSFPHAPIRVARVSTPALPATHPLSLSVVDGIAYASSPDGTVTALQVSNGNILWHQAGSNIGEASTSVIDGMVYIASLTFEDAAVTVTINALRANDGSPLWSRTLPADSPTPIALKAVNGVLYVGLGTNSFEALRASDGSLLWHYSARTPFSSMPSVADGVVYLSTQDGHVYALRAGDGFPLWKFASLFPSNSSSPTVADDRVYLNLQDGSLDALRASNGTLLWRYRLPSPLTEESPSVADGMVYVSTLDGSVYALRASDGSVLWHTAMHVPDVFPSLIVVDGVIYVQTLGGSIAALRANDGSILWLYNGEEGDAGSITAVQGVVYLALQTGGINSIAALSARDGSILWRYTPQVSSTQLPPILVDDLVLTTLQDGSIDALRASNGALLWHLAVNS
jgi:outer membrane protein assembly factor BamB